MTPSASLPLTSAMCSLPGFRLTEGYLLGSGGEELTTLLYQSSSQTFKFGSTNVYADGQLLATYGEDQGLHFQLTDPLGTRRVQTTATGSPELNCQSFPYGDQMQCTASPVSPNTDASALHFTGKHRDGETGYGSPLNGNDYFGARYYSSNMGRFLSPDNGEDQSSDNPQSWNLYSYGRNNPLIGNDADGRTYSVCDANGQNCSNVDDQTFEAEEQKDKSQGESFANGTLSHTDADGNTVKDGTYKQTDVDIPGDAASNIAAFGRIGNQGMGAIKVFSAGSLVGGALGGAALTAVGADAGLSILTESLDGVLSRAGSAVGNQGAKVASREVAEEAAKKWVGEGAREITERGTGKVVGEISADGTKVARFTSADTKGYINLVDKITGGNLHVGW